MTKPVARKQPPKPVVLILAGLLILGAAVCLFSVLGRDKAPEVSPPPANRPGSAEVYDRISKSNDCAQLQREFDTADANHTRDIASGRNDLAEIDTSYMQAANDRMKQIGC